LIDNMGWRWVFYINLPVGVIGLLMAMAFVPESTKEKIFAGFDWFGAFALGASLASLVLVLDQGLGWGWTSMNSFICYISTLLFAWIFVKIEKKQLNPIVDLNFFKNSLFVNVLGNNFIVFMSMMGAIFMRNESLSLPNSSKNPCVSTVLCAGLSWVTISRDNLSYPLMLIFFSTSECRSYSNIWMAPPVRLHRLVLFPCQIQHGSRLTKSHYAHCRLIWLGIWDKCVKK